MSVLFGYVIVHWKMDEFVTNVSPRDKFWAVHKLPALGKGAMKFHQFTGTCW